MADCYQLNVKRLQALADEHGYVLNSDSARIEKVAELMAENYQTTGEWICPCKQTVKPPQKGVDIACPCPSWHKEIKEAGHCHCRLFFSQAAVNPEADTVHGA